MLPEHQNSIHKEPETMTNFQTKWRTTVSVSFLLSLAAAASGETSFLDDFSDGDHADGSPVTWASMVSPYDRGTVAIQDGNLVLTPNAGTPATRDDYWENDVYAEGPVYRDVNIHTQVRALVDDRSAVGISGLSNQGTGGENAVWGLIVLDGDDRYLDLHYDFETEQNVSLASIQTDLSHITTDLHMRLAIVDRDVSFTVWPDGTDEPETPTLSGVLPPMFDDVEGHVALLTAGRTVDVPVAFRHVEVTTVPEPSGDGMIGFALAGLANVLSRLRRRRA